MIIMFLAALLTVFCGQIYMLNFSIQGLNRAIINTPIEMMYTSVEFSGSEANFNNEKFESLIISYYDNTVYRYCSSYDVEFYHYNENDGSMCIQKRCKSVEINFECKLTTTYKYHRVMYYEIRNNNG